jgi:hypothetical protein
MTKISEMVSNNSRRSSLSSMVSGTTKSVLRQKFNAIKEKYGLQFSQLNNASGIAFSIKGIPRRFIYMSGIMHVLTGDENKFTLIAGSETPESKAIMKALLEAKIITSNGYINYEYPED